MTARSLAVLALLCSSSLTLAQTGYTITGGMSNFDCTNRCDSPCDELEVEIEGIHPEDVIHCYRNSNYSAPTITLSSDGSCTIVDYRNPQHLTQIGSIEHFGVTLRSLAHANRVRVRWFRNGLPATVNGQLPIDPNNPNNGSVPSTQPLMPSIAGTITNGSHGQGGVQMTVTNNDPMQPIFIKRRAQITNSTVSLEDLMTNNPVVTNSFELDAFPILVGPGQSAQYFDDLIENEEELTQSAVFSAKYYQVVTTGGIGPFSPTVTLPGPELGNVMTTTVVAPNIPCESLRPFIDEMAPNTTVDAGERVDLRVRAHGDDVSVLTYQWLFEGEPLTNGGGISGVDTSHMRINSLSAAREGLYSVRVTNACATLTSPSCLVYITGTNEAPARFATCPTVINHPLSADTCSDGDAAFNVAASGTGPFTYQWQIVTPTGATTITQGNNVDPNTGIAFRANDVTTDTLMLSRIAAGDLSTLRIEARVINGCGSTTSAAASLTVSAPRTNNCPAVCDSLDFNNDNAIDPTDVDAYFSILGEGLCLPANSNCSDLDFNNDGNIDPTDVDAYFSILGDGPCL